MDYKISAGTIARTIILLLALVNQILTVTGHSLIPINDDDVTAIVSTVFTMVTAIAAWWKNNSFTKAALAGDDTMKTIKSTNK